MSEKKLFIEGMELDSRGRVWLVCRHDRLGQYSKPVALHMLHALAVNNRWTADHTGSFDITRVINQQITEEEYEAL